MGNLALEHVQLEGGRSDTAHESEVHAFGGRIQAERRRLKLTQNQLARAFGVSRITLAKYEAGRTVPDIRSLALASETAGLDLVYVATGARTAVQRSEPDWESIGRVLAVVKEVLISRGQEITASLEGYIVGQLYLAMREQEEPSRPAPVSDVASPG